MRRPAWLGATAALLLVYAALMLVAARLPWFYDWDWLAFERLAALHPPVLASNVAVVDLTDYDGRTEAALTRSRGTLAAFLAGVRARPDDQPRAVILDFSFSAGPQSAPLARALAAMPEQTPVFATVNLLSDATDAAVAAQQAAAALDGLDPAIVRNLAGVGAATFGRHEGSDGLAYQICFPLGAGTGGIARTVWSLPYVVVPPPPADGCDPERRMVVRLGALSAAQEPLKIEAAHPFPAETSFAGKYVVVGALAHDVGGLGDYPNPLILTWALSDRLQPHDDAFFAPLLLDRAVVLFVVGYSLLTLLAFGALFALTRRLPMGRLRRVSPWLCAAAAGSLGLAMLACVETALLAAHVIQPQVSLSACGIVLTALLAGIRGRGILLDQIRREQPDTTAAPDYDVFLSYAHDERGWVEEHVLAPLRAAQPAGTRPLRIFYDRTSIDVGASWQETIALAIDGSRFIVPVYSEAYFGRNYCRYEIMRAHLKWIASGRACVLPIMRGRPAIPAAINDIQAVSIDDDPEVVARVVAKIVTELDAEAHR